MKNISRVRKVLSIIKHRSDFTSGPSYYPECERKSPFQILKDQICFV